MPVRIEEVPNLALDDGYRVPKMDPHTGAARAKALESVSQAIGDAGGFFKDIARTAQTQVNQKQLLEMQSGWSRAGADFQAERSREPDPVKQVQMTDDFIRSQKQSFDGAELAPVVRQALEGRFSQFADDLHIGGKVAAASTAGSQLAGQVNENLKNARTPQEVESIWHSAHAGGVASEQDLPKWQQAFREKQEDEQALALARDHPAQYLEKYPAAGEQGRKQPRAGRFTNEARQALQQHTADVTGLVLDKIDAHAISGRKQIDEVAADLRPHAREQLYEYLDRKLDPDRGRRMEDPKFQDEVKGQLTVLLKDYHAAPDSEFDAQYVKMAQMARSLGDGALKDELLRQLDAVRKGQTEQAKTLADLAAPAFQQALVDGRFGDYRTQAADTAPLGKLVADGLLRDGGKLQRGGLSAGQADAVVSLNGDQLGRELAAVMPPEQAQMTAAKLAVGGTDASRAEAFRLLYGHRAGSDEKATPLERSAFEALHAEQDMDHAVTWGDPAELARRTAANTEAIRRLGAARSDFADWVRVRPGATEKEIDDKVFDLLGRHLRQELLDSRMNRISGGQEK